MTGPDALVFGSVDDQTLPAPFLALSRQFARNVELALVEAGLTGRFVDTSQPLPDAAALAQLAMHGVVLLGGGDVDPALYGADPDEPTLYGVHREVDDAAIALIHHALDAGTPVLAICRGAQLVNIARGGTLVPDLAEWEIHRGPSADTVFVTEDITLDPDSEVARIYGTSDVRVLNGHHQAIDVLGDGLHVTGRAADGVVEAIELDAEQPWLVGVQWHPEHEHADRAARSRLFSAFAAAVRDRGSVPDA